MEALAEHLRHLDSRSEGAIRVIAFYDTLMRRRVDLPALARASAGLAECTAGIRLHGTGQVIRVRPDGSPPSDPPPDAAMSVPITIDEEEIGTVWLERPDPTGVLDDLLLDRLAIAVAAVVERYGPAHSTLADPALVELVISSDSDDPARARALRLLGFAGDLPVRVIAVRTGLPLDQVGRQICPTRLVKAAPLADVGAILATTVEPSGFPAGVRAGIGVADDPGQSWHQARTALRFTSERQPVVGYDDLGALGLLAQVPEEVTRGNVDVLAIARLSESPEDLRTLDIYCATGSLRRAAEQLHLHHSSVARRLEQIGRTLGIELTEPIGLTRASVALTAWRLLTP